MTERLLQTRNHLGSYRIVSRLAKGGMSDIFLGYKIISDGLEKTFALKCIESSLLSDPTLHAMFIDEVRLLFKLDHPNIVQVFDLCQEDNLHYLVMEYIDGYSLAELLKKHRQGARPLELIEALEITQAVLKALDYVHQLEAPDGPALHIVHRDISPSNILISKTRHVKLCDFGLAFSDLKTTWTRTGIIKGKLHYVAPEQFDGTLVDARSDLFSLGVCLWEMLAGQRLFAGDRRDDVMHQILRGDFRALSRVRADLPKHIHWICDRALEYNIDRRFQNADEFLQEIRVALADAIITQSKQMPPATKHTMLSPPTGQGSRPSRWLAKTIGIPIYIISLVAQYFFTLMGKLRRMLT